MEQEITRRQFFRNSAAGLATGVMATPAGKKLGAGKKPNVLLVFADQWRVQDTGFAGNLQVRTPHLDRLAGQSAVFSQAVSGCPVCSPYRASLLTGQYWLTHGIFYNDKPLAADAVTMAKIFAQSGYSTGYIGKWHLNGHPPGVSYQQSRNAPIPPERRQGFTFWKVRECTHDYNQSYYFDEEDQKRHWEGYDAVAQTRMAQKYIRRQSDDSERPFLLVLSWGPPHDPYHTAPEEYRALYPDPEKILLRPNVPAALHAAARKALTGYYAHIAVLDYCLGELLQTLHESGLAEDTILIFTSDHGDMLYSQGETMKQKPWDESIRVPLVIRYPAKLGNRRRDLQTPINTPDILPTLLGLCSLAIPKTVEGKDYSSLLKGNRESDREAALLYCVVPFHQWSYRNGGREYRGIRTSRYSYIRDLKAPWLLYDNHKDPCQLTNLCHLREYAALQKDLETLLQRRLRQRQDRFLSGPEYMQERGYTWDGPDAPKQIGTSG